MNIKKDVRIFFWDGSESARMVSKKKDEFVKFRWLEAEEEGEDTFFELRIESTTTGENSLIVTDFADDDELKTPRTCGAQSTSFAACWAAEALAFKQASSLAATLSDHALPFLPFNHPGFARRLVIWHESP